MTHPNPPEVVTQGEGSGVAAPAADGLRSPEIGNLAGQRYQAMEIAARDARDRILSLIDSGEKLTARAKEIIERAAEDIRLAVNLPEKADA